MVFSALENFIVRTPDFKTRTSRGEFWVAFFAIWAVIVGLFVLDFVTVWDRLAQRKQPSFNPLEYSWFIIYLVSAPSRLSLCMRRLHDGGLGGHFVIVPVAILYFTMMIGFGTVISYVTSGDVNALMLLMVIIGLQETDLLRQVWWPLYFLASQTEGLEILWGIVRMILDQFLTASAPGDQSALMRAVAIFTLGPFLAGGTFLALMLRPSDRENRFGPPPGLVTKRPAQGQKAFAGYAALVDMERDRSPQEQAAREDARKAEVQKLYQERVLGRSPEA